MDDDFNKDRANLVRELANKADPFTKKRLLDLAIQYEAGLPVKTGPLPLPTINERIPKHRLGWTEQGNGLSGTGGYAEAGSMPPGAERDRYASFIDRAICEKASARVAEP